VTGHPGLLLALTQSSYTPVVVVVEPQRILVEEIKVVPAKVKVKISIKIQHHNGFHWVFAEIYWALVDSSEFGWYLSTFTVFFSSSYWVLLGFTGFYWTTGFLLFFLLKFTVLERVLVSLTGIYCDFTGF